MTRPTCPPAILPPTPVWLGALLLGRLRWDDTDQVLRFESNRPQLHEIEKLSWYSVETASKFIMEYAYEAALELQGDEQFTWRSVEQAIKFGSKVIT